MKIKEILWISLILFLLLISSCKHGDQNKLSSDSQDRSGSRLKMDVNQYPDSLQLIEQLIQFYRDAGNYDSALMLTDKTILRDSGVAELWDIKATLHYENEDTANSIKSFEKAIDIYPLPEYIISLGTLYAQTRNSKALVLADALIQADKSKAQKEAIFIKGLYFTAIGNSKKAMGYFDSCIRLDYTYMFAYREKAIALFNNNNYQEALQVLTRAITVQNNFEEGYYWMGMCYEKLGKKEDAIQSYQTALMYDKDYVEALAALKRLGAR